MPRPMLRTPKEQAQTQSILSATQTQQQTQQTQQMDKMKLDRILRAPRSKAYMDALHKLDAGGHTNNQQKVDAIINAIKAEFPEVTLAGILLGYVSKCYLGAPYEVHSMDMAGHIIEHYQAGETLPNGMEKARSIAIRGSYDTIEVYSDCCRAISSTGMVSVITC